MDISLETHICFLLHKKIVQRDGSTIPCLSSEPSNLINAFKPDSILVQMAVECLGVSPVLFPVAHAIPENGLKVAQGQIQLDGHFGLFDVDGNEWNVIVYGIGDFLSYKLGGHRIA